MKPNRGRFFLVLALLAALFLWLFLPLNVSRSRLGHRQRQQTDEGVSRRRGRRLALGLGTALAALSVTVGTLALVSATDGPVNESAAASFEDVTEVTASPTAAPKPSPSPTPRARVSPTLTPTPTQPPILPPLDPEVTPTDVAPGGDQPIGPDLQPVSGEISENVSASPEFLALRDTLAEQIEAYRALVGNIEVAIAVTDLQTGQTISVNGNTAQRTGCTINMFALFAAVDEFQAGRASPSEVAYNIRVGIGHSYPPQVKQLLQAVFGSHLAGVERARELMVSWGMEASLFDHVPYYGDGTQNNLLTALEVNLALQKLYDGEIFNPEWTAYALARLREIKPGLNYMLPGRLPAAATVAHKIGYYWDWDGWVNNDAGIVTFTGSDGQEKAYAITYLSQQGRTEPTGYFFGAWLSRLVWDWFEAKYRLETEPPPPPPTPTTPSPTPTPQPSPTPSLAPSPPPTPDGGPAISPGPTPIPSPGSSSIPTPSPTPSLTPSPTPQQPPQP